MNNLSMSNLKTAWENFQARPVAERVGIATAALVGLQAATAVGRYVLYRSREKSKPFNSYSTGDEAINNLDLTGKIAIVTGCNTGIGKETVKILVKQGCNVIMACRNVKKANDAKLDILNELNLNTNTNNQIEIMNLDLSNLSNVLECAKKINEKGIKINYLINNAGVMALPTYQESADGFEMQFATNHLGHFYFTTLIMPSLLQTNNDSSNDRLPRIINLSSAGHRECPPKEQFVEDLNYYIENKCFMGVKKDQYAEFVNYGISKAANIFFTRELQNRYNGKLISVSLHPGIIKTELSRSMPLSKQILLVSSLLLKPQYIYDNVKSNEQGPATTLRCVSLNDNEISLGHYYHNCNDGENAFLQGTVTKDDNGQIATKLWELSEALIKSKGLPLEL